MHCWEKLKKKVRPPGSSAIRGKRDKLYWNWCTNAKYSGCNGKTHFGSNGCSVNPSDFGMSIRFLRFQAPYLLRTVLEAIKNNIGVHLADV